MSAKRLRREAAGRTIGRPARAYNAIWKEREAAYGEKRVTVMTGIVLLVPGCTRAVYQQLKRAA